jgi:hypothetical protein
MMKEKLHNGYTVIGLIAEINITEMLMNPMMDTIVTNYWESPYTIKYYFGIDFSVSFEGDSVSNAQYFKGA